MTDFEGKVLQDLSVLKAQMEHLLGIGQPGRLQDLEHRVSRNEHMVQRLKGLAGAVGIVLTAIHVALAFFKR